MAEIRNIGINVNLPKGGCSDKHCPFHSPISLHGRMFEGTIIKKNIHKTAIIVIPFLKYIPKYERYEKKSTKLTVHNPPCQDAQVGDKVKVMETRPISKTKNFVIIQITK